MFGLLYGLFEQAFAKKEYYALILGLDNAGKTTLLERMKATYGEKEALPPDRIAPTVGLNIGRVDTGRERLVLWDLGGQSGLRSIWPKYYSEASGLLFLLDAADEKRLEEACSAFQSIMTDPQLDAKVPVLILLNKQDVADPKVVERMKESMGALAATSSRPSALFPICALNGDGVVKGVKWLVEQLREASSA